MEDTKNISKEQKHPKDCCKDTKDPLKECECKKTSKNHHNCNCKEDSGNCKCKETSKKENTPLSKEAEYLDSLQRLQAEFDNYRKRNITYLSKAKEEGIILAVEKLLPLLDSFNSASKQIKEEEFKAIKLLKEQLLQALKNLEVYQIQAIDSPFDPNLHNAVMVEEDPLKPPQTVTEVLQEGYMLGDKVIRHSVVKINN